MFLLRNRGKTEKLKLNWASRARHSSAMPLFSSRKKKKHFKSYFLNFSWMAFWIRNGEQHPGQQKIKHLCNQCERVAAVPSYTVSAVKGKEISFAIWTTGTPQLPQPCVCVWHPPRARRVFLWCGTQQTLQTWHTARRKTLQWSVTTSWHLHNLDFRSRPPPTLEIIK